MGDGNTYSLSNSSRVPFTAQRKLKSQQTHEALHGWPWPHMPSGQAGILDSCPPLQPPPGPCCTCVQAAHLPTPEPGTCRNHILNPSADTSFHLRPVSKVRTEDGK